MAKTRVLLAGETWSSMMIHTKGFDQFSTGEFQSGVGPLKQALADSPIYLHHMPGHAAHLDFPNTLEALAGYDVVVLSDIGANTLLLHPDSFVRGQRTPNRLKLIAQWVEQGGGFLMIGGYFSFQGLNGAARYARTPIETILPVRLRENDDRMEVPEGFHPKPTGARHPVIDGIGSDWPYLLGYNETIAKPEAAVLLTSGPEQGDHPILAAGSHGKGRTLAWTSDIGPHWLPETFTQWDGYRKLWIAAFQWLARATP